MKKGYTTEKNVQVIISLLKQHGIHFVVASPGSANMALVASLQSDPWFTMFSAVDERSAAYMACGIAAEAMEPVVITCTGATASRNYMPGMTEAFYRKLPLLAITSTQALSKVGHHVAQVIDRSVIPNDVAKVSFSLPIVKDDDDVWDCEIKVNRAILELTRHGGGPAHLNLPTTYAHEYIVHKLPEYRKISRVSRIDQCPNLPKGRIAIFIGSHSRFTPELEGVMGRFCEAHNAVVFCDHTSGYQGRFRSNFTLVGCQNSFEAGAFRADVLIHLGEVTGDYYTTKIKAATTWRVSPDGEIRDPFRNLSQVFEMTEEDFFEHYASQPGVNKTEFFGLCEKKNQELRKDLGEVAFSNIWLASKVAGRIPRGCSLHFGILNSLRAWNFFDLPASVNSFSNVGGFGIDGALSTVIGASFVNREKLYFCVLGDLAFFYDMNALGNRHLQNNVRLLVVNNGKGTEFKQYGHVSSSFGDALDEFVAAAGHFGNQSPVIVKHFAEDLGFEYQAATNKEEFLDRVEWFFAPEQCEKPLLFEVFTDSDEEGAALFEMMNLDSDPQFKRKQLAKAFAKGLLGERSAKYLKQLIKS